MHKPTTRRQARATGAQQRQATIAACIAYLDHALTTEQLAATVYNAAQHSA